MRLFYGRLRDSGDKAGAVRDAMLELRAKYPHPYYWAPFLLIGKAFQATQ
ncbi:MAG: CHAT domain-containing protein [Candidatus Acidiferrales bacterium]